MFWVSPRKSWNCTCEKCIGSDVHLFCKVSRLDQWILDEGSIQEILPRAKGLDDCGEGEKLLDMYDGRVKPLDIPTPYLAEIGVPDLEDIDANLIKDMFKNAPHLAGLQKEMCTPKFLKKMKGHIKEKKLGQLRKYQV